MSKDRFKFRYFNTISNKMVECTNYQNVDAIFECLKQQVCYDNDISPLPYDHIGNGLVFMQCTGLKDKNGKLVYEDDIIKWAGTKFVIVWQFYKYALKKDINQKPIDYILSCFDGTEFEVIGNIYENKNLLERVYNEKSSINF